MISPSLKTKLGRRIILRLDMLTGGQLDELLKNAMFGDTVSVVVRSAIQCLYFEMRDKQINDALTNGAKVLAELESQQKLYDNTKEQPNGSSDGSASSENDVANARNPSQGNERARSEVDSVGSKPIGKTSGRVDGRDRGGKGKTNGKRVPSKPARQRPKRDDSPHGKSHGKANRRNPVVKKK